MGEMSLKGLWETVIDRNCGTYWTRGGPGDDADEIFSRLMGDQVEPRREFIEQNALNVSSLDI